MPKIRTCRHACRWTPNRLTDQSRAAAQSNATTEQRAGKNTGEHGAYRRKVERLACQGVQGTVTQRAGDRSAVPTEQVEAILGVRN